MKEKDENLTVYVSYQNYTCSKIHRCWPWRQIREKSVIYLKTYCSLGQTCMKLVIRLDKLIKSRKHNST